MAKHLTTEQLSARLDGQLAPLERSHYDEHITSCEQCQHTLAGLQQTVALVRALPQPTLPRSFVLPVATSPTPLRASSIRTTLRAISTIAAVLGFLFLMSGLLPLVSLHNNQAAMQSVSTPHLAPTATSGGTPVPAHPQQAVEQPTLDLTTGVGRVALGFILLGLGIMGILLLRRPTPPNVTSKRRR